MHPNFSALYQQLGIAEQRFTAARKLLELFPIHAVLKYPISPQVMQDALQIPL